MSKRPSTITENTWPPAPPVCHECGAALSPGAAHADGCAYAAHVAESHAAARVRLDAVHAAVAAAAAERAEIERAERAGQQPDVPGDLAAKRSEAARKANATRRAKREAAERAARAHHGIAS